MFHDVSCCTINVPVAFAWCTINAPATFALCTKLFVHKVEFSHIGGVHPLWCLHSFWILEWLGGKRVHDTCRMDCLLWSKTNKKIISFSSLMIGYWFSWRIRTYIRQWRWKILWLLSYAWRGQSTHLVDELLWPNSWHVTWPDLIAWITPESQFWAVV